jgi:NADPH-dependent ferric siderophore reductase
MTEVIVQSIHRVMHEIKRRRLQVLRVVDLTPRMRRITLGGPELAGFVSLGTDDHVKLLFPQNAAEHAALETLVLGAGKDNGATSIMPPAMRDYTPRRYDLDTLELDIDFVLHGDGPASTWAEQAQPGQFLHIGGPRGSMIVPDMFDSYLLIGDETALPAIARRLEGLAANRRALVVVEVENGAEQQHLKSAAQVNVIWVLREGGKENLLTTVKQLQVPSGSLYAWVATETKVSRQIRRVLLDEHGLNEQMVKAVGYWRLDASDDE